MRKTYMWKLERARDPKITWVSLVGLILVPLLVSGGFLWATWNSDTRLDRVQAAIVNNDEGTTLNDQFVPLGRQLAGGLVNGEDGVANFDWVLTDTEDAQQGLENGAYAAVVTIPADFSKRATSFSSDDVSQIQPAEIGVQTSEVSGITDGAVAQVITTAARNALNTELTEQYLDNIYLGFNATKEQFESVASGARKLADGTGELSDGLDQTSTGAKKLADGLEQLDDGTQQLADGMTELADGTKELPTQTEQLADGAQQSADGADDLADGVKKYVGGVKQLDKQLPQFTKGLGETAGGAEDLAAGTSQLATGMQQYATGAGQFSDGLQTYSDTMNGFQQLVQTPDRLPAELRCPVQDEQACELYYGGLVAGTQVAYQGLQDSGDEPGLLTAADDLATNASTISTNVSKISTGVTGLSDGLNQLDTGAGKIEDGVDQLASNGTKLATGTKDLADGLEQLADGTDQLATGLTQLSSGIQQSADGTQELADGTSQSSTGGRQLSDGLVKLADGGSQLADGSDELATGLEKGAKQIPTYDKEKRTALSSVVATPVTAERPGSLFADIANTTFLSVIALWLGALASFVVLRAVGSRVLTSMKPSWRLAGEALLPAAGVAVIQAIALTTTLQILLELSVGQVATLLPFLVLAGLAFVAINHALVAWLGGVGRFISVTAVVLSAATAITEAIPPLLAQVVPFLPLTPALEGARAIASGGPGAGGSAGLLLAWLVVGVAAGVLAVARHRMAKVPAAVPVRA
jgi:putative membrane protein